MAIKKGVIVWKGDLGSSPNNLSKTSIEGVTDDAALATLVTSLSTHTDCNPAKRSFNEITSVTPAAPAASANVDKKLVVYMQNPVNLHTVKFEIPAPAAASIEGIDGTNFERGKATAITAMVDAINLATGYSYVGLYGKVIQR